MKQNLAKKLLYIVAGLFIFLGVWQVVWGGADLYFDVTYLVMNMVTVGLGWLAFSIYGLQSKKGRSLLFLSLGFLGWTVGEILWFYYDWIAGIDPFPSLADVFFVVGYPLFFFGLWIEKNSSKNSFFDLSKNKRIVGLSVALLMIVLVLGVNFLHVSYIESDLIDQVMHTVYSFGDLVLILVSFSIWIIVNNYQKGAFARSWRRILLGFVFILLADISFSFWEGNYVAVPVVGVLIDTMWLAGYFVAALGFLDFYGLVKSVQGKVLK